ncbi:predicted hydrolase or acyltransferase of alpha/beta superfamily [Sanguibacter keddieii DSM 10542]|uniref:Predicted hydrolase or acyltransferase of alpha/beta superfamily n=1 Tax=Sanguibacter keddieii (strain ATCC 51767 / DSM 10542 / NCFB 3025 / ST-74) TaxID=446469 RepID=D1BE71_SANKS|nr:alpha/beta hydrolase [Sanguibacter keddieii]ACZ21149.1 predicted hydrolase or acyltransferase of alpha/beta superfamily [Sanguibacter keddieii DSM 10542]
MGATTQQVQTDDGTTVSCTVIEGDEPAVVLLHGLAGSSRELLPTARALGGRRVVLVDQRGHGLSTTRPADTSREAFVADVVQVLTTLTSQPVVLVGQSMGAHTAMLVAAARPDLVSRLVMLEGNQGGGSEADHQALGDFFRSWDVPFVSRAAAVEALGDGPLQRAWVEDLERRADGWYPRFDADVVQAVITAVGEERWAEWESVEVPVVAVFADGGMFTEQQKAELVARGRDVRRVDLAGASHDAHLDCFDAWVAALRDALPDAARQLEGKRGSRA